MTAAASVHEVAWWIGEALVIGSLRGGVAVGVVWLLCRRVDSMSAAARASLWWLASFSLLLAVVPAPPLALPLLPPAASTATIDASASSTAAVMDTSAVADNPAAVLTGPPGVQSWTSGLVAFWLLAVGIQAVRLMAAHRRLRGVMRRSRQPGDAEVELTRRLAREIGLSRAPDVRLSTEIDAPQVVGFRRPLVLLPGTDSFTVDELTMTLYHELTHIRRRDLAVGWIPVLAERLFFFHPLAHLAAREYLVAREAACDAAVVRALEVEPLAYARLLVRFGITGSEPGLSAGGSSTSSSLLRRRLDMLERVSSTAVGTRAVWYAIAAVLAVSLPLKLVARTEPVAQEPNTAVLDAIETQARRLAEQAKPQDPALAERLRGEMESLRAQMAKLEEQRDLLMAEQRALVAALSELLRQLQAERTK